MSLARLSKILTGLIGLFILFAVAIGFWGWQQLDKPYQISQQYNHYQSQINNDVRVLLIRYLSTGNAGQLQQAETTIATLKNHTFDWLTEQENQSIIDSLTELEKAILPVRSAGKLAYEPEGLLINNERGRLTDITSLLNYVDQAGLSAQSIRHDFLHILVELNQQLQYIGLTREKYFSDPNDKTLASLHYYNDEFMQLAQQLQTMPRFGIYTDVDEDELIPDDPEEIGAMSIDSLLSLSHRYQKELDNTITVNLRRQTSVAALNQAMDNTVTEISQYRDRIDVIKSDISQQVKWLLLLALIIIVAGLTGLFSLQTRMVDYLNQIKIFLSKLVQGHYQQTLDDTTRYEEIQSVVESGYTLQDYFSSLIKQLDQQAQHISQSSHKMELVSQQASELTKQQETGTYQMVEAVDQLSFSFQQVSDYSARSATAADSANTATLNATQQLDQASHAVQTLADDLLDIEEVMNRLETSGNNINEVVNVIQSIAEQTNLLALNAAIEAARAGAHGRGFAVVADEVRNLASRTTDSTVQISQLINELVSVSLTAANTVKTQSGAANQCAHNMTKTQKAITPVVDAMSHLSDINQQIVDSTIQQSDTVAGIVTHINTIKDNASTVHRQMHDMSASGRDLSQVSQSLDHLIAQLKQPKSAS